PELAVGVFLIRAPARLRSVPVRPFYGWVPAWRDGTVASGTVLAATLSHQDRTRDNRQSCTRRRGPGSTADRPTRGSAGLIHQREQQRTSGPWTTPRPGMLNDCKAGG